MCQPGLPVTWVANGAPGWLVPGAPVLVAFPQGLNAPAPVPPRYIYHSTPDHWYSLLARAVVRRQGRPDKYVVPLFPFSLKHGGSPRDSTRLWFTKRTRVAQRRCYQRHFTELQNTRIMTTFQVDTWHPRFSSIPRYQFTTDFTSFERCVDVFTYEYDAQGVGQGPRVKVQLCPGNFFHY